MLGCGCGYLERVRIWHFGAVTEINSNLHEVITPGETADIDGFVLEKGNGDDAELYHAYTNLSGALNDAEAVEPICGTGQTDQRAGQFVLKPCGVCCLPADTRFPGTAGTAGRLLTLKAKHLMFHGFLQNLY